MYIYQRHWNILNSPASFKGYPGQGTVFSFMLITNTSNMVYTRSVLRCFLKGLYFGNEFYSPAVFSGGYYR